MYSNGTQYAADAAALCGYSLKLINVFYFFPLILNTCNIPLQPKPVENKEVNGDTVSVPKQVTVESMDNIESVFLHHPRHHRCCLTCGLSRLNITAQKVDTFSRFTFPVLFAIFNLTYWSVYMHKRREGYLAKEWMFCERNSVIRHYKLILITFVQKKLHAISNYDYHRQGSHQIVICVIENIDRVHVFSCTYTLTKIFLLSTQSLLSHCLMCLSMTNKYFSWTKYWEDSGL